MNKDNNTTHSAIYDLTAMFGGAVTHLDIDCAFPAPDGLLPVDCTPRGDIVVHGTLDNMSGYMRMQIDAEVGYDTVCARCLKPLSETLELALDKTVAARETVEDEDADEVVSDYVITDDNKLDVSAAVCEQLLLEFPFRHLCSEDCKGLCAKCGKNLNEGECDCPKTEIDPRLEILGQLLKNDNN